VQAIKVYQSVAVNFVVLTKKNNAHIMMFRGWLVKMFYLNIF